MLGYNVLHPMGWDAFGLPAEQYAIDTGTHPSETTRRNIDRFRQQLKVRRVPCAACAGRSRCGDSRPRTNSRSDSRMTGSVRWPRATCSTTVGRRRADANMRVAAARASDRAAGVQWIFLRLFERGLAYQARMQ